MRGTVVQDEIRAFEGTYSNEFAEGDGDGAEV